MKNMKSIYEDLTHEELVTKARGIARIKGDDELLEAANDLQETIDTEQFSAEQAAWVIELLESI